MTCEAPTCSAGLLYCDPEYGHMHYTTMFASLEDSVAVTTVCEPAADGDVCDEPECEWRGASTYIPEDLNSVLFSAILPHSLIPDSFSDCTNAPRCVRQ